jgi:uroporphyrin-III C-methyltransferase
MSDTHKKIGEVYLIGAGPGDAKLLTIKAAEAIAASDLIVYDYLVNPEILVHSQRGAQLLYVGKRAGEPSISQDEINRILIERAGGGAIVARLKGGDPFIFGRGGEEAEALSEAGIKWSIIPGISSGVAAAAYAGIPLTHRGYSSSVAFITGHDSLKRRSQIDWQSAAHFADTLVIFMCAETIKKIARSLIEGGRAASTPLAIIRWGTYQHQEVYSGTLEDLVGQNDDFSDFAIKPPAIAIVGEVVALKDKLNWFKHQAFELDTVALLNA